jgi:hypothetical protein
MECLLGFIIGVILNCILLYIHCKREIEKNRLTEEEYNKILDAITKKDNVTFVVITKK